MRNTDHLISNYIKLNRLRMNKTQKELAEEAGISLMTLRRAEKGEISSFETIVSLLEIFGELENFMSFFSIQEYSPRDLISGGAKSKVKQRVRKSKSSGPEKGWKWGDQES